MDFTAGKIGKNILLFSIPLILGNFFQQMYTFVNSAFVGKWLSVDALAAVGSCYPVVFFITSMVLGIGSGGSVVVSHYFGAKQYDQIHTVISTFYIFFIALGIAVCGLSILSADFIFSFLNMEEGVKNLAVEYFRIYMLGMFFSVLFHSAVSMLRGLGDSVTQLYFLIPANILNMILSYIFIGVMHLGVEASAVASLISQFLAFVSFFIYLHWRHDFVHLPYKNLKFNRQYLKQIVSIGIPTGVQQSVVSLTQILILSLVVRFGTNATAAYSSAMRIESIALLFVLNISQALTSFVGMNVGAGQMQRAKRGFYSSLKIMACLSAITLLIFTFGNTFLMKLFTDNKEVINIGNGYLAVSGIFWFLFCWQMMYTAFFRGAGKATVTMVISILSLWIVRWPVSYVLSLHYGTLGIWLGAPVAWLTGVVIYIVIFKSDKWQMKSTVKKLSCLFAVILSLFACNSKAQQENNTAFEENDIAEEFNKTASYFKQYPQNYFISPLKIPLTLAGTFAELRGSHFHSGLDIRTNERTGYAVIAPADGYVSRIKIQAYGGGKNLYITHPNGYTTVYMHLDSYSGKIGEFVKSYQYRNKCYTFDYYFKTPQIYVKQGDTIAISGETGMVQGPHLHFEIRDSKTEQPINPILFGINIKDTVEPYIVSMALSPMKNSSVEGKPADKIIGINKNSDFKQGDTIECYGNIYFSVLAYDPSMRSSMRNGVWKTELFADSVLIFSHHIEKFSFTDYGFVDATINYPLYIKTNKRMLCSRQKDNGLLPFNKYRNKGILNVKPDSVYKIQWKLTDLSDNSMTYTYYIKGVFDSAAYSRTYTREGQQYFRYNQENNFTAKDGSQFVFPKNSLYEDIDFKYSSSKGTYSDVHRLHTVTEPVKKKFTVRIKPYKTDNTLKDKYLVVKINSKGGKKSVGGELKNGFVETVTGDFGNFAVWIDTIAPNVKPSNFKENKIIHKNQKTLKFSVSDNLSGVDTYNGYLNGEWVLLEFDGRRATLIYNIDEKLKKGKNEMKIVVTDAKNNKKTAKFTVVR